MARKTYSVHGRSNPPIEFVKVDGRWHYRMEERVAEYWRSVRESV